MNLSREQVLASIRERVGHPSSLREMMQVLRVPRDQRIAFRSIVRALVGSGALVKIRGNRFGVPDKMNLVVGRLQTNPNGFGFVVPERDGEPDIFIPPTGLKDALHGDRVVARVERYKDGDKPEGQIVRVLERGSSAIVGRFRLDGSGLGVVEPFDRRVLMDVYVPHDQTAAARPGDMVVLELVRWPTANRSAIGRVREVLGDIDAPGVDVEIVIRKHGIPDRHSEESVAEARALPREVLPADLEGRTDFRSRPTVTIDGETARDFDDAISIERLESGHYLLGVHIADVAHYVPEGGALDQEAFDRGTSVYFPERAVHMFPPELATGLCSLNPEVDRLTQSAVMEIDRHGEVVRYELHDAVIHSDARMTYTAVNRILTDLDPAEMERYAPLVPMFELMAGLFHILSARRHRRGSIDFDLPEPHVVLGPEGQVEEIVAAERNIAHRLIEEFMLVANETVAAHLFDRDVPALYRVHEEPDPLKVELFEEFIGGFGYSLAAPAHALQPRHFQRLVERIKGRPEEKPIAFLMLRTMQRARYAAENLGHFGLAAKTYTHFTSPIRRYPDLVVHRMLRESRRPIPDERREELLSDLPDVARHTSEMERRADDAERELVQWKKVKFMADKLGEEYDGYVTGVTPFGLFIELVEHFVEGLVHVSSMADDYYHYNERAHTLTGENTEKVYRLGDRVRVQVVRVDLDRRQIDLGLVEVLAAVRRAAERRHEARPRRARLAPRAPAGGRPAGTRQRVRKEARRERQRAKRRRRR